MKCLAAFIVTVVLLLPVAFGVTFVMSPFWGWLEAKTGIESLGHSGPADWCFSATYAMLASAVLTGRIIWKQRV